MEARREESTEESLRRRIRELENRVAELTRKARDDGGDNADDADGANDAGSVKVDDEELDTFLSQDNKWTEMYRRLKSWSEEKGHCNPRRNWKAKIDEEEKALGNWSGKQRREDRTEAGLDPYKKAALKRLGFSFNLKGDYWDEFYSKLKVWVDEHGSLPSNLNDPRLEESGLGRTLTNCRSMPKSILGLYKRSTKSSYFNQEQIDKLTEFGLDWKLTEEQVEQLKEKGYNFPVPKEPEPEAPAVENEPIAEPETHLKDKHWRSMYKTLVEFKESHGHTYVTPYNSTEEFYDWVKTQRTKMRKYNSGNMPWKLLGDQDFFDYQEELLSSIGFIHSVEDCEWMENYERLMAFKRLFGIVAVPNKYVCFDDLQKWVDDQRWCLYAGKDAKEFWKDQINTDIPFSFKQKRMYDLGLYDFGPDNETEVKKSNYYFRTVDEVNSWSKIQDVLHRKWKKEEDERRSEMLRIDQERKQQRASTIANSWIEKKIDNLPVIREKPAEAEGTIDRIHPQLEHEVFRRCGLELSASIPEYENFSKSKCKTYCDGRPIVRCRVKGCFSNHSRFLKRYLCNWHFDTFQKAMAPNRVLQHFDTRSVAIPPQQGPNIYAMNALVPSSSLGWAYTVPRYHYPPPPIHFPAARAVSVVQSHLTGEAKILSDNYRAIAEKVAKEFHETSMSARESGEETEAVDIIAEVTSKHKFINHPDVSEHDEAECVMFFRRSDAPFAATFPGYEKLHASGGKFYGDRRPLDLCRLSGCQHYHGGRSMRFLCGFHFRKVYRQDHGEKSQPNFKKTRMPENNQAANLSL